MVQSTHPPAAGPSPAAGPPPRTGAPPAVEEQAEISLLVAGQPGPGGMQKTVTTQPAPAVAGDFCDANPRSSFPAGPGGLVAGVGGVTIGNFAWLDTAGPVDADGVRTRVLNAGAGAPNGFVHREQQGLITLYLAFSGMLIPAGFGVTLMTSGGYWVVNAGAGASVVGQKAFASNTTGAVAFAAAAGTVAGSTETKWWCASVGAVGELVKISSSSGPTY